MARRSARARCGTRGTKRRGETPAAADRRASRRAFVGRDEETRRRAGARSLASARRTIREEAARELDKVGGRRDEAAAAVARIGPRRRALGVARAALGQRREAEARPVDVARRKPRGRGGRHVEAGVDHAERLEHLWRGAPAPATRRAPSADRPARCDKDESCHPPPAAGLSRRARNARRLARSHKGRRDATLGARCALRAGDGGGDEDDDARDRLAPARPTRPTVVPRLAG